MPVTAAQLEEQLAELRARITRPEAGIYGPGSISWTLLRENVILLGGGCAALLQLAHPYVAYAVDQHSLTRRDPVERFRRTFAHVFDMVFGDVDHAIAAARRVHTIHTKIRGRIHHSVGAFQKGDSYLANDESALFWVQATLTHTSLRVYELLLGPLMPFERERYYQESRSFSRLFGIPDEAMPTDLAAFEAYMERMVASDVIAVSPPAAELAAHILTTPSALHAPLFSWLRLFTAGLLPPKLRAPFGLRFGRADELAFRATVRAARAGLRALPPRIRYQPAYIEAEKRLLGEEPHDRVGRFVERVALSSLERRT